MYIKNCKLKVFKVNPRSVSFLIIKDQNEKGEEPKLLLTASIKNLSSLNLRLNNEDTLIADIMLTKDNSYNIWLVIKKVYKIYQQPQTQPQPQQHQYQHPQPQPTPTNDEIPF